MIYFACAVVLLLVVLNGIFAMSELAIVSSRKARLQTRADRGDRGARAALKLAENPTRFLSAVQVGITLIGILAGAYGQATIAGELDLILEGVPVVHAYSEPLATGIVVVVLTYLSLIVGELVPKRLALIHPETIAAVVARPLSLMARAMGPFVTILTGSTSAVLKLLRVRDEDGSAITQEEVETVLAEGAGAGVIEPAERTMMQEIMRLGDRPVRVAMTPRREVFWISSAEADDKLRAKVQACPYSRFVVAKGEDFDSLLGVVHKRDVANSLLSGEKLNLERMVQDPLYLPETTSLLTALERFRTAPTHMAFIVDEFGGFEGVVTPTDLLEMIVGDLPEGHDMAPSSIVRQEDGAFLVDGKTNLVELGDVLKEDLGHDRSYHTVAGLILDRLERFPHPGEIVRIGRFEFEIIEMDERRIDQLRVREVGSL